MNTFIRSLISVVGRHCVPPRRFAEPPYRKAILALLSGVLLFAAVPFLHATFVHDQTKIVTWNLCWFPGRFPTASEEEKQVQMQRAQKALQEIAPDIFLCQEVASWQAVEQLTSVVPGLKPAVVSDFGPAAEDAPPQNVAIATTFPVISGWAQKWNADGRTKYPLPRGFAFAAIEMPNKDSLLLVYSVHLKSNHKGVDRGQDDNAAMREESSKILRAHIAKMSRIYGKAYEHISVLVGGDFNTSLDDERFKDEQTLRAFTKDGYIWGFEKVSYLDRITIPGSRNSPLPPVGFDHFFSLGLPDPVARVLKVKGVSDHYPVEMVILTK